MEKGFYTMATQMLSGAGFTTSDNKKFTLNQQGYHLNNNISAVYIVELDEESDRVYITCKTSAWETSPESRYFERFTPCSWGWKTADAQVYQLKTYLRNIGCNIE